VFVPLITVPRGLSEIGSNRERRVGMTWAVAGCGVAGARIAIGRKLALA